MRGTPHNEKLVAAPAPAIPQRAPAPTPKASSSRHAKPKVLMDATAAPRGPEIGRQREAFRNFMKAHRLRPTQWAKDADVPLGEILGYLTGKIRALPTQTVIRLARAAKVSPESMFQ
jgi:hypothetical protein